MVNPSGIRHSDTDELQIHKVRQGLYTVENAYEGVYEYFKNRPILIEQDKQTNFSLGESEHNSSGFWMPST